MEWSFVYFKITNCTEQVVKALHKLLQVNVTASIVYAANKLALTKNLLTEVATYFFR